MGVSWEEMTGTLAPNKSEQSTLPGSAVSAEQMFGSPAAAQPRTSPHARVGKVIQAGAMKYWEDYVALANQYSQALKGDIEAEPFGLADTLLQTGKTALDALGAAFSPLEAAARTGIIQPAQALVDSMSALAQEQLSLEETPQERRERFLSGQKSPRKGVNWAVHKEDVARTAGDLNKVIEVGTLTATGLIGGKRPAARMTEADLKTVVRMSPERTVEALTGVSEARLSEMALKDPLGLQGIADHVSRIDEKLSTALREKITKAEKATPAEQEALGETLAKKPVFRKVGTTAEGKPRVRLVPEEELATTMTEGSQASMRGTTPKEVVAEANRAYAEQLLREEEAFRAGVPLKTAPMVRVAEGASPELQQFAKNWNDLHDFMAPRYIAAAKSGQETGAHSLLDVMIAETKGDYPREFITKLRQHVDNVPVKFVEKLETAGLYHPDRHAVTIKANPTKANSTHALLHELTHAATVKWLRLHPEHVLVNELEELLHEAKQAIKDPHYGLGNVEEFVAEAMTNTAFQRALLTVKWGKWNLFSRLASIVRRAFNLPPSQSAFLSRVMRTSEAVMAEQKVLMNKKIDLDEFPDFPDTPAAMAKPRVRLAGYDASGKPVYKPVDNRIVFHDNGLPVTRQAITDAFDYATTMLGKLPGMPLVMGKLKGYYEQVIQTVNPEAFGAEAKAAAAVIAKRIAESMQKDSWNLHRAALRRAFWNHRTAEQADFIKKFEKGEKLDDPLMDEAALAYRVWNERILNQDLRNGFEYEPVDNYLYHLFQDGDKVSGLFDRRYGAKWGNPKFIKERGFELYSEAVAAGHKPRFTNPEDIMLARQHASDVAQMRIDVLNDLERFGLAVKAEKGAVRPESWPSSEWRAPNGEKYWVHDTAGKVMHNAFNTKSLWTMQGIAGDLFRGAMWLKNTIVPIKLALSLFHPLHVLTIHNATGMVRASKELLSGNASPARWLKEMAEATLYTDTISSPRAGGRLLRAYQGKIKDADLTPTDVEGLRLMAEGGFIPEMSSQYRTQAWQKFKDAVQQRSLSAAWHLPFAAIDAMQKPMFQIWIPSLKIASYLKDVRTAFRTNPELMDNPLKRQVALRRIAKSVDNRYGEMAYNTLFWNRWVKDLMVANTLSLGWQMGFIREYGGGMLDLGQMATTKGGFRQKVASGMLDRPLFVAFYTTQALAYGGLMTWALSGETPKGLLDYVYPKNGELNDDETPQRVSTMFYPREFAAIYKHMENEGVLTGLGHLAANKASGVVGLTREWATGINSFGQEIRDPNAPAFKQLQQTLTETLTGLEPISVGSIRDQATESPWKTGVMNVAGFSPAPRYVTEPKTEASIRGLWQKYYAPRQTPYEKAAFSREARLLKRYWQEGDQEKFGDLLDEVEDKYELTAREMRKLETRLQGEGDLLGDMFARFTWQQQKRLLDQMTEEERDVFLPRANKEHLRYSYEAPEER